MPFSTIPEAIADLKAGKMIVLTDDEDRENEGDLVALAEHLTPEMVNFMVREGRGVADERVGVFGPQHALREREP